MPNWKRVIVSGSNASLSSLQVANSVTASIVSSSQFTGSLFGTASWATNALSASHAANYLLTASVSSNTIEFTKGNGSTFSLTVDTGSGGGGGSTFPFNGNAVITGSLLVSGSSGGLSGITGSLFGTSSWAVSSSQSISSSYASNGGVTAITAGNGITINQSTGNVTVTANCIEKQVLIAAHSFHIESCGGDIKENWFANSNCGWDGCPLDVNWYGAVTDAASVLVANLNGLIYPPGDIPSGARITICGNVYYEGTLNDFGFRLFYLRCTDINDNGDFFDANPVTNNANESEVTFTTFYDNSVGKHACFEGSVTLDVAVNCINPLLLGFFFQGGPALAKVTYSMHATFDC
jgi:hypothetical protein